MSTRRLVPLLALCLLAAGCPKPGGGGGTDGGTPDPFAGLTADATVKVSGMTAAADVLRDEQGIAHIFCKTDLDCIRAEGYVMAHDRLFEMDFYRHYAEGRLGAITPSAFVRPTDRYYRRMMTGRDGTWVVDAMDKALPDTDRAYLQAFTDGVNAYIADIGKQPWAKASDEYQYPLLNQGVSPPAPWTIKDSLAVGRLFSYQLSNSFDDEVNQAVWASKLDPQTYQDLQLSKPVDPTFVLPNFYGGAPLSSPLDPAPFLRRMHDLAPLVDQLQQYDEAQKALRLAPLGPHPGSNDWIVSAGLSSTGHPLVANDPHLSLYAPSVWWSVHLDSMSRPGATGSLEAKGNTFPGVPGVIIGTTQHIGWGVTTVGYDVTDVYVEQVTGVDKVSFNGQDVTVKKVTVKMPTGPGADQYDTEKVCVVPEHGPIMMVTGMSDQDLADPSKPCVDPAVGTTAISVRWTGQDPSNELGAFRGLLYAQNVNEAKTAIAKFQVGAQNFVVGDTAGHILYDPHATVPIRGGDLTTNPPWLPMPGDGSTEWTGTISDADLPQAMDPQKGWVVTANNDQVGTTEDNNPLNDKYYLYFTNAIGIRAGRITKLLKDTISQNGKVSPDDMKRIQNDAYYQFGALMVPFLQQAATDDPSDVTTMGLKPYLDRLANWSFDTPTGLDGSDPAASSPVTDAKTLSDSIATTIFASWYFHALDDTLADELTAAGIIKPGASVPGGGQMDKAFYFICKENKDTYFDNVSTTGTTETRDQVLLGALKEAVASLTAKLGADPSKWLWGRLHVTDLPSPFGAFSSNDPYKGPTVANNGGLYTVDVSPYGRSYHNGHGPSMRIVTDVDPAGVKSWQVIPGGEIDFLASPNREDQLPLWLSGDYLDIPFSLDGAISAEKKRDAAGTLPGRWVFGP